MLVVWLDRVPSHPPIGMQRKRAPKSRRPKHLTVSWLPLLSWTSERFKTIRLQLKTHDFSSRSDVWIQTARATQSAFILNKHKVLFHYLQRVNFGSKSPAADVGAPPSPRFHWAAQSFSRGRVSPACHDSPHLSRAHRSQTPLTQHAPYSLLAVTTRGSSCTKGRRDGKKERKKKKQFCKRIQILNVAFGVRRRTPLASV